MITAHAQILNEEQITANLYMKQDNTIKNAFKTNAYINLKYKTNSLLIT